MATTTFEIEKRLGNNGWIPPEKQQLLRSRNDSEIAGVDATRNAGRMLCRAAWTQLLFHGRWRRAGLLPFFYLYLRLRWGTFSAACCGVPPHIPMCGLRALGPHVMERIRACSFAAAALLQAPFDGWVVWFCTPDLCARTYVGISYGRIGRASCLLQLVHRHFLRCVT